MGKKNISNEIIGGELTDYPNEKYRRFFDKFAEIEILKIEEWKPVHVLGFFCKKYKEHYQTDYTFKFNSPSPLKCFEVFQIKKLCMLLSSNPTILKEYIDWIYRTKVVQAKRKLTSISFLTHEDTVKWYLQNVLLAGKKNLNVDRSTPLPDQYREIFQTIGISISTYGELTFLSHMAPTPEMVGAFQKMEELGFDKEVLERIV
jgi:hypothetical protein